MKFTIALSSILAVCSVTTATPIFSSSTTSTESSTSTVITSAQATPSVDLGLSSKGTMDLIKEYVETEENCEQVTKTQKLVEFEEMCQENLVTWLEREYQDLKRKFWKHLHGPRHRKVLKKLELEIKAQYQILCDLEESCMYLCCSNSQLYSKLRAIKVLLEDSLLKENSGLETADAHTQSVDASPSSVPNQQS
ncbi:hypothetical protein BATDEDRAFT_92409 [Batrachochytrium dendrobatidis JAM81]|uniref:Uncharacterized protein n=2 Tax=Batrachochytrium dendrobatidis TaxID=109871 RepID=F4PDH0_BATDJ|nr:uncharacterized protein BATDEDRAFT_92409 [Batrachochytrium dendrobatidis JAM81]EGF76783.1 hypothetical protein BATDEDRAFT_92409 [Batrachochytrium dendrobatidis JAM81]KAK5666892.1 hypothetical protein QVD99_006523 [Batrachochytrium dendrobatidis]OAJ45247.1 hypothetical protein BDEG_28400 [Batrachochytrium dendrobatidis JEL423]|eukprot:XP_006682727.1 hypothetical protein BATDEDRAFT_92409 [Batrachochytrium dendrobatidis JAM81]